MTASSTSAGLAQPQAAGRTSPRRLAVAWQHPDVRSIQPVGMLTQEGAYYEFHYIRNAADLPDFSPFVGFPELHQRYRSKRLFPLFSLRVMDPRRPDYPRFVRSLDLPPEATPWEQLARSEGRRAGDTILLFPEPVIGEDGATQCNFLVHGIRHMLSKDPNVEDRLRSLMQGDPLLLIDEPDNPVNPQAILTADTARLPLGWVPDLLLHYVHAVRSIGRYDIRVSQINGPEVPFHLRLLVHLSGRVPAGYRPFSGKRWEPLA